MCVQHEETKHLQIIFLADLTNSKEIAQRFGHLTVINIQECIMHPVMRELLAAASLALCDLVLMMREDQILSAAVDVDLLAQIFLGHDRALNVPARTALSPRGLPVDVYKRQL